MALLQKLKEKLGIGGTSTSDRTDTEVTVEHDPDGTAAGDDQGAAAETDAAASTETLVDEDAAVAPEEAAEPAEAAGPDAQDREPEDEDADAEADAGSPDADVSGGSEDADVAAAEDVSDEDADESTPTDDADGASGTPVETIKGIGPAYAERLAEIGIDSVEDLADADAAAVGEKASVGESRAATWIERANEA
ncbi:helix-hairpin-helix domain-containing protein [haloarchaeon 3A1-DGR]|nr:helix-hairpin-helix domain-containing protein [haloarchaeon 3A1-DGR]